MPVIRVTVFFKQEEAGWTETYFLDRLTLDAATSSCIELCNRRADMLTGNSNLVAFRTSIEGVNRDARLVFFDLPKNGAYGLSHPPFVCVDVRMEAGTLYRRTLYLRGIPKKITTGTQFNASPDWQAAYQAWKALFGLQAPAGWSIYAHDPAAPSVDIITVLPVPGEPLQKSISCPLTQSLAPFPDAGGRVVINAPRGTDVRGSVVVVQKINITTMIVKFPKVKLGGWVPGMRMKVDRKALQIIDAVRNEGINHRDTGRPFDLHHGRARAGSHTA
jgi:hypothetical protein